MDERAQAETRAWRLALLLTGSRAAADEVALAVLSSQPDLLALEPIRRDRLVLLRARERAQGARFESRPVLERLRAAHQRALGEAAPAPEEDAFQGVASAGLQLALRLRRQPMEAWTLHRVLGMEMRETARAMDCSITAATRHLEEAEQAMSEAMGADYTDAINAVRGQANSCDPSPLLARRCQRIDRARRARNIALAVVIVAALGAVGLWLIGR